MLGQLKLSTDGQLLDKVELAIQRLKAFEPPEGYYVAFSGGKDSQCIYHLCQMAGVKFDAHYNVTSVDPPELVKFIKTHYPDVKFEHQHDKNGKPITMWSLIPENCKTQQSLNLNWNCLVRQPDRRMNRCRLLHLDRLR